MTTVHHTEQPSLLKQHLHFLVPILNLSLSLFLADIQTLSLLHLTTFGSTLLSYLIQRGLRGRSGPYFRAWLVLDE